MLYCVTWYPGYRSFSSARSGAYLVVFSSALTSRLSIHGQLISITDSSLLPLSTMVATILFAVTKLLSAYRGTSQYAAAGSFSYIGLGLIPEYQGSYVSIRSRDLEEQDFQCVVVAFQVFSLRNHRATRQDVLHALWSFTTQSTPLVSSRGRSGFPAVELCRRELLVVSRKTICFHKTLICS